MHGIERTRKLQGSPQPESGVRYVIFRYGDGREVTFIPDAEREFFSEDDMLELQRVVERASSAAEWSEVTDRAGVGG